MFQLSLLDQSRRQRPEMLSKLSQLPIGLSPIRCRPRRPLPEDRRAQYPVCLHCDPSGSAGDYRVERDILAACAADGGKTVGCGVVGGDAVEGVAEVVGGVGFLGRGCQRKGDEEEKSEGSDS